MAAPAFAFEGEAAPVEQPVLPEIVEEEDTVTITDEEMGALMKMRTGVPIKDLALQAVIEFLDRNKTR